MSATAGHSSAAVPTADDTQTQRHQEMTDASGRQPTYCLRPVKLLLAGLDEHPGGWLATSPPAALTGDYVRRMAALQPMPAITFTAEELGPFGAKWIEKEGALSRSKPQSSLEFGEMFDAKVGAALATMLGGIPIVKPNSKHLTPSVPDCVEVGPVRVVGGVRPQNFDVGYRPDGVRFAYDSKTLNDKKSVAKNYQNMINDLATEATTVHSRFPYAVVAFIVAIPAPCLSEPQNSALIGTLERLGGRFEVDQPNQMAETMTLVVWDPESGEVLPDRPAPDSITRIERFSETVEKAYRSRYKGLPPHAEIGAEAEEAEAEEPGEE